MPLIHIPGLINAFLVENLAQLRELESHPHVSPTLSSQGGLLHRTLASPLVSRLRRPDLEWSALARAPVAAVRARAANALPITGGELYRMASYVAGNHRGDDLEITVQRWLARRFTPRYEASAATRAAARLIGGWHRRGALRALASAASGHLSEAERLIASSLTGDGAELCAPLLLLPQIVMGLERMRKLARDPRVGARLSPERVVAACIDAPRFAYRTCTRQVEVSFLPRPLPAHTLLVLPARRLCASEGSAFERDASRTPPALRLLERLLTEVWVASRDVYGPHAARSSHRSPMRELRATREPVEEDGSAPRGRRGAAPKGRSSIEGPRPS
jgi:hypothetical protein